MCRPINHTQNESSICFVVHAALMLLSNDKFYYRGQRFHIKSVWFQKILITEDFTLLNHSYNTPFFATI